ncbi:2593_t:CDS:1, partial [Funneliformis caledonium]
AHASRLCPFRIYLINHSCQKPFVNIPSDIIIKEQPTELIIPQKHDHSQAPPLPNSL